MEFRILGPLEVLAEGRPLALTGHKPRAVLAVLLLEANRVVSRDRLVDALWGEDPPETAHKALQVHVSQLRKLLGRDRVETRSPGYRLRVEPGELDVDRFQRLHDDGRLDEALALWRGPPLADLAEARFAEADAARLEELRLSCLEDRVERDLARGRHAELVGELQRLTREHPSRERLYGQLMLSLYRSGRQSDALDAYRRTRRTLVEELGIEPGRALRELEAAILRQDPALDAPTAPSPARGLVGRERELADLLSALEDALGGSGRLVLVAGEPGIGKSRLADELIAHAEACGAEVLVGRCWEAGGAPAYWPWMQALRAHIEAADDDALRRQVGRRGADLATLLPELRERLPDLPDAARPDSEAARFRLLDAVTALLRAVAAEQPLLVMLDDLHAADTASLLLLRFVAGHLAGVPLLVAGCYRDTEVGAALGETLAELAREPALRRIALSGLEEREVSQLLEATLGEPAAAAVATRVRAQTGGNPLFAGEVARLLASGGVPAGDAECLPIPAGVRETILQRVQRRSPACREVMELACAVGREFDPEVLGQVGGLADEAVQAALDEAAPAGLVDGVPGAAGRLRFAHILVRDALYETLPAPRRARLHAAIGQALEARYAGNVEPHLAEIAHHYGAGGAPMADRAVAYAQRAGDRAVVQHAYEEAAWHFEAALRGLEALGADEPDRCRELLLALGEALSRAGRADDAKRALREAAALAEQAGRPDQLARAALEYGGRFAWARASTDPALVPLLERALEAVGPGDSPERVRLLARLAAALRDEPSHEWRVRLGEEALEIARRLDDPRTLAAALEGHWVAAEQPALIGLGLEVGAQLISLGDRLGDLERRFAGHDHRLNAFWRKADRAGVEVELEAMGRIAEELRQPAQNWHVATGRTMLALMEGRLDDAERLIVETAELGRRALSWNAQVTERLARFVLRRLQGRLAEVEPELRRSVYEYPALLRFRCALAHLYAELDREAEARAALDAVLSHDLREHRDAEWLFSVSLLPDACAFLGDAAAAEQLYEALLPFERSYAQAPAEAVFGSMARGLGVLAGVLGRVGDARRHYGRAITTERAMGATPWLAMAETGLANLGG